MEKFLFYTLDFVTALAIAILQVPSMLADDAAGLLRVAVEGDGETAIEVPFAPFGDATTLTNFISGPFFAGDGDAAPDWLLIFPESFETNYEAAYSQDGWKLTPITVEVPTEENETCCKKSTFEYLTPVAKVGGACVAIYATYKVVKVCGGGAIGFFVGGPLGAIGGVSFCLGTP